MSCRKLGMHLGRGCHFDMTIHGAAAHRCRDADMFSTCNIFLDQSLGYLFRLHPGSNGISCANLVHIAFTIITSMSSMTPF